LQHFECPAAGTFRRGLPSDDDLKAPAVARVFLSVLRTGFVSDIDFTNGDDTGALQKCFHKGWLHTDKFVNNGIKYFFPSSLYRWYVEWKLWSFANEASFDYANILELVINVISIFSPRVLSTPREIGSGRVQRLPEAQYQDEFYRCCHTYSKNSLITFPEFGTAKGRADFYIPAKKWGVELLRDASQLAQHCGRFSSPTGLMEPLFLCPTTSFSIAVRHFPECLTHVRLFNSFTPVIIWLTLSLPPAQNFRNCTMSCSATTSVMCKL
jgi:hypothetical protein